MFGGRNGSPDPELFRPDGIQKAFPKDKSTRFACKGICVAPGQPVCARHHRRNMVLKPPKEGRMNAEQLWADFSRPIVTADDYITSLSGRRMNVFFMGERVEEPVEHPVIFPSINAMAETYRLASERPDLGGAKSDISGDLTTP